MATPFVPPSASAWRIAGRLLFWIRMALRVQSENLFDRLRGRASPARRARSMRRLLEAGGGVTVRLGRQAAMRLDLLSVEMCDELDRMTDPAAPMPLEWALSRVEAACGGPLSTRFEAFDPEPIHTDAVGADYQAILLGGQRVVVRVRQRDIALQMNAEQAALGLLLTLAGPLLDVRPEFVRHMQLELRALVLEDLDFQKVARRHNQFRKRAQRDRVARLATATRPHMELVRDDVLVTDFVDGVRLDEVLAATETPAAALPELDALGISADRLGRRLLRLGWWDLFENLYFSESIDPTRIVVTANGQMILVGMENCGALGKNKLKTARRCFELLLLQDVEGAVAEIVRLLEPVPPVNLHEFRKRMERRLWLELFAMVNRASPVWQRNGVGLWLAVLKTTREMRVPVRQEVLRFIRASIRYGVLATRLAPEIRYFRAFESYLAARRKRVIRRARRGRKVDRFIADTMATRARQYAESFDRVAALADSLVDDVPLASLALTSKSSYTVASLSWAATRASTVCLFAAGVGATSAWLTGENTGRGVMQALTHPLSLVALLIILGLTGRKLLFRLEDLDPGA